MNDINTIKQAITRALSETKATDIHTHIYGPEFGELLLWGIDDLLTHHYLIAEAMRWQPLPISDFYKLSKREQAELVWRTLFIDHTPVSAPAVGLLDILSALGCDVGSRNLESYRAQFAERTAEEEVELTLKAAGLDSVVMTNDPFDDVERAVWESKPKRHPKFHAAIRVDGLVNQWESNFKRLAEWGYDVEKTLSPNTIKEASRFLEDWIERVKPLYLNLTLPPEFAYPADDDRSKLIDECILPICRKHKFAFAVMIGVKRQINPELGLAGDGVGKADINALINLCRQNRDIRFISTMLSRENQYELAVVARKFPNLMIFGTWWFMHIPSIISDTTRMRMELLGTSFIPQHSDVRVLEQTIGKWAQSRKIVGEVLAERYLSAVNAGWKLTEDEIRNDVENLFGGNFWRFIKQ